MSDLVFYEPNEFPLYALFDEIKRAVDAGLNFLAISATVSIPDICAALADKEGKTSKSKYLKWCQDHIKNNQYYDDAFKDLYSLRCNLLHEGRTNSVTGRFNRFIFVPKNPQISVNAARINDASFQSVGSFCDHICLSAYNWLEVNKNTGYVLENSKKLVQYRTRLLPYVEGIPILA
jgi:hypothetical protein